MSSTNIFPWKFAIRNTYFSQHFTLSVDIESVVCFYKKHTSLVFSFSSSHANSTPRFSTKSEEKLKQSDSSGKYICFVLCVCFSFDFVCLFGFANKYYGQVEWKCDNEERDREILDLMRWMFMLNALFCWSSSPTRSLSLYFILLKR